MPTTETLEKQYEHKNELRVRRAGNYTEYTRYFNVQLDEFEDVLPSVGDTHSVNTTQIVVSIGTIPKQGALRGLLPVTYRAPIATGSGI